MANLSSPANSNDKRTWDISLVDNVTDEISKLWYQAYVLERGHTNLNSDHVSQRLFDPLAPDGNLFVAKDPDGKIVGTILTNYTHLCDPGFYTDYFGLVPGATNEAFTTKLVVSKDYRRTRLAIDLALATYAQSIRDEITVSYVDCQPKMRRFFLRLGKIEIGEAVHPKFGRSSRFRFDLYDRDHMVQVGSPFVRKLDEFIASTK